MYSFIHDLENILTGPLPGRPAQMRMASLRRLEELGRLPDPPADARVACVMNLLHFREGRWHTLLIQRTENPRDRHSGQVSFPGGRYEEHDGALEQVALRETEEEVGVPARHIRVLGRLTDLYIPVSNYLVHPFVGLLETPVEFVPQPGEVEAILTPPIGMFRAVELRKSTDLVLREGITLKSVPYFDMEGRVVWGATAMILSEFAEILDQIGFSD